MQRTRSAWKSYSNQFFLATLASGAILTAGCANMASTSAVSDTLPGTAATMTGHVHGGNQPIAFATVTLNFAGSTGPGSAGAVIATTTTADDGAGSFSFTRDSNSGVTYPSTGTTYSCPLSTDPVVYLKAVGGNTQNTHDSSVNNTASVFLAALGRCKEINTAAFLNITEVTTVATVAALQQYIDPAAETIGADGTGVAYQAITNSSNLVSSNLVNLSTGTAVSSTIWAGGGLNLSNGVSGTTPVSVTATPTSAKLNTLANIIAACVNSTSASGAPCTTLFQNATPPAYSLTDRPYNGNLPFNAATDVLQAAYYMLTNPTNGSTTNLGNLYNIPVGVGAPFQPALSSAPSDWTIAIAFSSPSSCGTNSGGFINSPYSLSVDLFGDIWIANGQSGSGNLSEISPIGIPVVCLGLSASSVANPAAATTIDSSGNFWQGSANSLTLSRYNSTTQVTLSFTSTEAPITLAADGLGNVYFTTALGDLFQIPAGATTTSTVVPTKIATNLGTSPAGLMVDDVVISANKPGEIWTTSGGSLISRTVPTSVNTDPAYLNGFSTTQVTTPSATYGIGVTTAVSSANNVLVSLSSANQIDNFAGSGTSHATVANWPTTAGLGGLNAPTGIALDSKGNIWAANSVMNGGLGSVSVIGADESAISPAGGLQQTAAFSTVNRSIVIDQSGNVWVGGDGNTFVTEIVGAADPVYQPFSRAIAAGRFQQIP